MEGKAKKKAKSAPKKAKTASKAKAKKEAGTSRHAPLAGLTTFLTRSAVKPKWHIVNVDKIPLGRAAAAIAQILRGKHVPQFHPSQDFGDFVVAINAQKIGLTGRKPEQKTYYSHSGHLGHLKRTLARHMLERKPERVLMLAVKRMLPPTRLGRDQLKRLFVYAKETHPHGAQKPENLTVN